MTDVHVAENVLDRIENLDEHEKERVKSKIFDAGDKPDHYLKPLTGDEGYRIRVGDYRVIVEWDKNDDVLYVTDFGKRDGIY
ncbi:MAG: type II toxin-antitoxin system RelE/ParE family toxin [Halobacteriales archaeon]|nr:type II toxin-antitoxin system RelE/ParE family toxin [Halobacteriales archaeon]